MQSTVTWISGGVASYGRTVYGAVSQIDDFGGENMDILMDKVFVIAEIGVNHEGDPGKAREMLELAAEAGADAVKFQTYLPEHYISASQPDRLERVRRFSLSFEQFRELADRARGLGVGFISTPLDFVSLDLVAELSPVIKISSGDINYLQLLQRAARTERKIILSTGLAPVDEIDRAVTVLTEANPRIQKENKLVLLHCVAAYPTPEDQINLLSIPFLRDRFQLPVGFSDHTMGILASQAAVALGARVIEKHFTYRKENQTFHDHKLSAEPNEFREMVRGIRRVEAMLGRYGKEPMPSEKPFKSHLRRSLAASRDLLPEEHLSEGDICFLRPELGIPLEDLKSALGKRINKEIKKGEIILKENLST
jgi:N-acetylneuraminate synthase/N,N'-diacetyllegionaminate synthase